MKKKIILTLIFIGLVLAIILTFNNAVLNRKKESKQNEVVKDITFFTYDNSNDILKILVTFKDNENGLREVSYTEDEEEVIINCNGKIQVSMDYEVEANGIYEFKAINSKGEEIRKSLNVNEEYRNSFIEIQVKEDQTVTRNVVIKFKGYEIQ